MRSIRRILVYGESDSDRESIRQLILALCPGRSHAVEKRQKPLLLAKNAAPNALAMRASKLAAAVRADEVLHGPVVDVYVHEDADGFPPSDEERAQSMTAAAAAAGLEICAVVPAWEIEAWWLLFPEAVAQAFPSWRRLKSLQNSHSDRIKDAKQTFTRATSVQGGRKYQESDGPRIAAFIRSMGVARSPSGRNASYHLFCKNVDQTCSKIGTRGTRVVRTSAIRRQRRS